MQEHMGIVHDREPLFPREVCPCRRRAVAPRIALLVLTLLAASAVLGLGPPVAAGQPLCTFAVFPFRNQTGDSSLDGLGFALAEALNAGLPEMKGYVRVSRVDFDDVLKTSDLVSLYDEPEKIIQTGRLLGAHHLVVGAYDIRDSTITVTSRFVSTETGVISSAQTVSADSCEIYKVAQELALKFTDHLGGKWDGRDLARLQEFLRADPQTYVLLGNGLLRLHNGLLIEANTEIRKAYLLQPESPLVRQVSSFMETMYANLPFHAFLWESPRRKRMFEALAMLCILGCVVAFVVARVGLQIYRVRTGRAHEGDADELEMLCIISLIGIAIISNLSYKVHVLPDGRDDFDVIYDALYAWHRTDRSFGFVLESRWQNKGRLLYDLHILKAGGAEWEYCYTTTYGFTSVDGRWVVEEVPRSRRQVEDIPWCMPARDDMRNSLADRMEEYRQRLAQLSNNFAFGLLLLSLVYLAVRALRAGYREKLGRVYRKNKLLFLGCTAVFLMLLLHLLFNLYGQMRRWEPPEIRAYLQPTGSPVQRR